MVFIYVLKLVRNKYYVGKTSHPLFRLHDHFNASGSHWTMKYSPKEVLELIDGDEYDEDKYVIKYMCQYGINNVRGGSFSQFELAPNVTELLSHMIKHDGDKCFKCGKAGHFASDCKVKSTKVKKFYKKKKYKPTCYKCGKKGHYANECKK